MSRQRKAEVYVETQRRGETKTAASYSDWVTLSFGEICQRVQNAAMPSQDGERLYLGLEHLASGQPSLVGRGRESDVKSGKTGFRSGDVLFGKLRPYLRKSVLVTEDGICSTDILAFRSLKNCIPEYLCFLTHTDEFIAHSVATTSGVQHPRTSWSALRDFKFALPPLAEQRKIAGVLGLVQRAMEQQERLIALTTELKKALLHQLFTQGLRGEPQKQTEIGPVPESWEVRRLGDYARVLNGYAFKSQDYVKSGVRLIRISNVAAGTLIEKDDKYLPAQFLSEKGEYALEVGDLILSLTRPIISDGIKFCFVQKDDLPALLNQRVGKLQVTSERLLKDYLSHVVFSDYFTKPLRIMAEGSNQPNISPTRLENFLVPIPTNLEEQAEIAKILTDLTKKAELANRKHAALTALFRTLLHQLMTAQLRVHDLDLPDLAAVTEEE